MDFPNSEFWDYSTHIWTLPDVEKACLDLQNNHDINVNILMYCCWVADKNLTLNDDDIQALVDTIQPWHIIIKPLRESRKMMQQQLIAMPKDVQNQTLNDMQDMELNAEHMSQLALEKTLQIQNMTPNMELNNVECSLHNIKRYLNSLENNTSADDALPQISLLLSAIFQDEDAVQVAMMS